MKTDRDLHLNDIEATHHKAIKAAGYRPEDWLIEAQVGTWRERHGWELSDQGRAALLNLSRTAASRYELVEALHPYRAVLDNIAAMQVQSIDRLNFGPAALAIATSPGDLAHPRLSSSWHTRISTDLADQEPKHVIWMPLNFIRSLESVAGLLTTRLLPHFGDVQGLVNALAQIVTWDEALELLRPATISLPWPKEEGRATIVEPPALDLPGAHPDAASDQFLKLAMLTFVAGHEAGHVFAGHVGDRPPIETFTGAVSLPPALRREINADSIGIMTVWDGMSANAVGSIDETWIGPIVALAYQAGFEGAYPAAEGRVQEDLLASWIVRLEFALERIGAELRLNGFAVSRGARILPAALNMAVLVYEYRRSGGELGAGVDRLGPPGEVLYAILLPRVRRLLDSLDT